MTDPLADALRRLRYAVLTRDGQSAYAEVYATNRTSDYLQADDGWYRQAMAAAGPIWLGDLEYDASSESHGIDIVIRLYDAEGRYQGILKAKRDQAAAGVRQLGTRVRRDGVTEGMGSGMGSDLAIRVRDGVRSCNQGQGWGQISGMGSDLAITHS